MASYLESTTHKKCLQKGVEDLLVTGKFSDVTLVVDGKNFPAHKAILCSMVPYFDVMFSSNMQESCQKYIKIQDVDAETFGLLMDFVYKGGVTLSSSNIWDVVKLADMWQVDGLVGLCKSYMQEILTYQNSLTFWEKSEKFWIPEIIECTKSFALKSFGKIKDLEEILQCQYGFLNRYLNHNDLNVQHEEDVATVVLRWIKNDENNRKKHLFELLQSVRLTHLDLIFIQNGLRKNEMVKQNEKCKKLVEDVLSYKLFGGDEPDVTCALPRPSTGMEATFVTVTSSNNGHGELSSSVYFIGLETPNSTKITKASEVPFQNTSGSAACVVGRSLYVSGLNSPDYSDMWKFDCVVGKWQQIGKICPYGRQYHVMLPVVDKLYILGGQEPVYPESLSRRVDCYDIGTNSWNDCCSLEKAVWHHLGVLYEWKIYCMGGTEGVQDDHPISMVVQEFDVLSKKVRLLAPTPKPILFSSAVVYKGKILVMVVGGLSLYVYDIQSDAWSCLIQSLPLIVLTYKCVVANRKMYIIETTRPGSLQIRSKPVEDILSGTSELEWQKIADCQLKPNTVLYWLNSVHQCNLIIHTKK